MYVYDYMSPSNTIMKPHEASPSTTYFRILFSWPAFQLCLATLVRDCLSKRQSQNKKLIFLFSL